MNTHAPYPDRSLLWALGGLSLLALGASLYPSLRVPWQLGGLLLAAMALADLVLARAQPVPRITRQVAPNLAQGSRQPVKLALLNPGRQTLRIELHDHPPEDFRAEGMPVALTLRGGEQAVNGQ